MDSGHSSKVPPPPELIEALRVLREGFSSLSAFLVDVAHSLNIPSSPAVSLSDLRLLSDDITSARQRLADYALIRAKVDRVIESVLSIRHRDLLACVPV